MGVAAAEAAVVSVVVVVAMAPEKASEEAAAVAEEAEAVVEEAAAGPALVEEEEGEAEEGAPVGVVVSKVARPLLSNPTGTRVFLLLEGKRMHLLQRILLRERMFMERNG